jgi:hypothetical protein
MALLLCILLLAPAAQTDSQPDQLLKRAQQKQHEIEEAKVGGRDLRPLYRELLVICTDLRRTNPDSLTLCLNEGNAASLAGDWVHALLAYRLAQRIDPTNKDAAARLTVVAARLQVLARAPTPADEVAADLGTKPLLRLVLWTLAFLLYGLGWLRIAGMLSGRLPIAIVLPTLALVGAAAIVWSIYWADAYRTRTLGQPIGVVRRGEPALVREGNGLSYPTVSEDRLRPGTELRILGKRGDWLHLRTPSGLTGWIPAAAALVE